MTMEGNRLRGTVDRVVKNMLREGADAAIKRPGWYPASEHPPVDKETGFSELVVGIMPGATVGFPQYVRYQKNKFYDRWIDGYTGVPSPIDIKCWCYPPDKD